MTYEELLTDAKEHIIFLLQAEKRQGVATVNADIIAGTCWLFGGKIKEKYAHFFADKTFAIKTWQELRATAANSPSVQELMLAVTEQQFKNDLSLFIKELSK